MEWKGKDKGRLKKLLGRNPGTLSPEDEQTRKHC